MAATILAEAWEGQESQIRWMYYARIKEKKGVDGLNGSTAYRKEKPMYKVWLYMLGDKSHAKSNLPQKVEHFKGYLTVEDYCTKNGYVKTKSASRADYTRQLVDEMYECPHENPYKGWKGQGNIEDFNNEKINDLYWKRTRAYYWLQESGKVSNIYVEVMKAGANTQFIFDGDKIKAYWDKPGNKLPAVVKKYKP